MILPANNNINNTTVYLLHNVNITDDRKVNTNLQTYYSYTCSMWLQDSLKKITIFKYARCSQLYV